MKLIHDSIQERISSSAAFFAFANVAAPVTIDRYAFQYMATELGPAESFNMPAIFTEMSQTYEVIGQQAQNGIATIRIHICLSVLGDSRIGTEDHTRIIANEEYVELINDLLYGFERAATHGKLVRVSQSVISAIGSNMDVYVVEYKAGFAVSRTQLYRDWQESQGDTTINRNVQLKTEVPKSSWSSKYFRQE